MATTTTVPNVKLGQNGSDNLNNNQIAVINTNFSAVATDYAAADDVVTAAYIAADAVVTAAYEAADTAIQAELDALEGRVYLVDSVTPVDNTDGTATVTIQVNDAAGTAAAEVVRVNCWLSDTAGGAPDAADTSLVVATGTQKQVYLAAADLDVLTDATGAIVLTVTSGATSNDQFCNAEIGGRIVSAEVTITGP